MRLTVDLVSRVTLHLSLQRSAISMTAVTTRSRTSSGCSPFRSNEGMTRHSVTLTPLPASLPYSMAASSASTSTRSPLAAMNSEPVLRLRGRYEGSRISASIFPGSGGMVPAREASVSGGVPSLGVYLTPSSRTAAGAAHVDAGRKAARAVADRLADILAEDVVVTLRGICSWMARDAADVGTQLRERLRAVRSLAMAIGVYHHKRGATELNTGDSVGKLAPPTADLHFVGACPALPVLDARRLLPGLETAGDASGKDGEAGACMLKCSAKVGTSNIHGRLRSA